jgi:amino acid transporter
VKSTPSTPSASPIPGALARNKLGPGFIISFVMGAAAPLTVTSGVIPTAYGTTGIVGLALAFLLIGALLALFSVGYSAMQRRITNAGAFYAYISQGISRMAGVPAAWVALLAYNLLQVGLYGAIGVSVAPLMESWLGLRLAWWAYAAIMWAIVAILGLRSVKANAVILAGLMVAEVGVVLVYFVGNLTHPAGGVITFEPFNPAALFTSGFGAAVVIGITGFVGFEASAIYSEEARDQQRTVPRATYLSLLIIAVLYSLAAWGMVVATGAAQIAGFAGSQQGETTFTLAATNLGQTAATIGHALFASSIFAAMISYHNAVSRYFFALGREGVLPALFGTTTAKHNAPKWGSLIQTIIGIAVIAGYGVAGLDPLVQLFFWLGTTGGFGVLLLLTATSLAVLGYRLRRKGENVWRANIAPTAALILLLAMLVAATMNFATLLGVAPDSPLRWIFPASYLVPVIIGLARAIYLRTRRPEVYRGVGLGVEAETGRAETIKERTHAHEAPEGSAL